MMMADSTNMTVRHFSFSFLLFFLLFAILKLIPLLKQQNTNWWSWDLGGLAENGTPIGGGAAGLQTQSQPQSTPPI